MPLDFASFSISLADPDRLPVVMAAILLVSLGGLAFGSRMGNANPLIWLIIDTVFGPLGDRLDRVQRPRSDLIIRGFILTMVVVLLSLGGGYVAHKQVISMPYYGIFEILLIASCLTSGAVWKVIWQLYQQMSPQKSASGGYFALSRTTRTALTSADDFSITRAGLGLTVVSFDKGLVAPVFWYVLAGLPALFLYTALAALSWRFGKKGFSKGFGVFPMALERIFGWFPGLLSAILIAFAGAFTPTAGLTRGFLSFFGHKGRATYEQGGFPLSSLAWSLKLSLGGPSQDLGGSAIQSGWVGPDKATARNDYVHLRRALYINLMAHLLFIVIFGAAYLSFAN
jgi:adenosylcobinamide-phosphate synthase